MRSTPRIRRWNSSAKLSTSTLALSRWPTSYCRSIMVCRASTPSLEALRDIEQDHRQQAEQQCCGEEFADPEDPHLGQAGFEQRQDHDAAEELGEVAAEAAGERHDAVALGHAEGQEDARDERDV